MKNKEPDNKGIIITIGVLFVLALFVGLVKTKNATMAVQTPVVYEVAEEEDEIETEVEKEMEPATGVESLKNRNVHFVGFNDLNLTKASVVKLQNPASNEDFLMQFVISNKETGEVVYESEMVESTKFVEWNPYETLGYGKFDLVISEMPFWPNDDGYVALSAGNNEVHVEIMEESND